MMGTRSVVVLPLTGPPSRMLIRMCAARGKYDWLAARALANLLLVMSSGWATGTLPAGT